MSAETLSFAGRVALVTGAGRGIGKEYATLLASRGAAVVVNDRGTSREGEGTSPGPAESVAAAIVAAGGEAVPDTTDVSRLADVRAMVDRVYARWGRLDIVVNNAGITIFKEFADLTDEECVRVMDTDFWGTFNVIRAVWPRMTVAGYGRIVNSSSDAILGDSGASLYGASKGAVMALTKSLAVEGAPHGVLVNAVLPVAFTRLADVALTDPQARAFMAEAFPPREVADLVGVLAHESTGWNGELFQVGGGRVARASFGVTRGFVERGATAETLAEHSAAIFDPAGSVTAHTLGEALNFAVARVTAGAAEGIEVRLDSRAEGAPPA
ncbi:SDR family NAD(P)-dependent oxidoreductase [Streptomyces sp. NPDC005805]|uniref:SDR family NAD(P)-dependent oxidoreductase n=1 Tax=Streptomyces sp. NPDC005805 TaxID=3157068 RepID=UPI0033E6A49D